MEKYRDEVKFTKRKLWWITGFVVIIVVVGWFLVKSGHITETAFINYEQFQEIYTTCSKLNTDLGIIRSLPEDDRMFESFSRSAVIANKQQQLTRWVEEFNAKSKMWHRSMWKSKSLPYQLNVQDFSNF